jgi:hypothetical protein
LDWIIAMVSLPPKIGENRTQGTHGDVVTDDLGAARVAAGWDRPVKAARFFRSAVTGTKKPRPCDQSHGGATLADWELPIASHIQSQS